MVAVPPGHSPAAEVIGAINHVNNADDLGDGRWRIHFQPENSPAAILARQAVENNWGLYELTPEHKSLEQIFVDITTAEQIEPQQTHQEEQVA